MNQTEAATSAEDADSADAQAAAAPPALVTFWHLAMVMIAVAAGWMFFNRGWHLLDRPPPSGAPGRPLAFKSALGMGLFVGSMILAQLGLTAGRAVFGIDTQQPLDLRDLALLSVSRYMAEALVIAVFAAVVIAARRPAPDARPGMARSAVIGAGALLLFWPMAMAAAMLVNTVLYLSRGWIVHPVAHEALAILIAADRTVWFFILTGLAVLVAPVFEEVIYRGLLQESLVRIDLPRWPAIVATSAIFAAMHIAAAPSPEALPGMLAALFLLSLGFGWVYEKTGSLAAPIAMHILFNAGNLAAAMWAL